MQGCASNAESSQVNIGDKTCRYIERDLTANWDSRSYWCLPASEQTGNKVELMQDNTVGEIITVETDTAE